MSELAGKKIENVLRVRTIAQYFWKISKVGYAGRQHNKENRTIKIFARTRSCQKRKNVYRYKNKMRSKRKRK